MAPPVKLRGRFRPLIDSTGSVTELARQLGVDRITVWKWARGMLTPSPANMTSIRRLASRLALPDPYPPRKPRGKKAGAK
jgi:hypothetical protein